MKTFTASNMLQNSGSEPTLVMNSQNMNNMDNLTMKNKKTIKEFTNCLFGKFFSNAVMLGLFILLLFSASTAQSATITAVATGNWNSTTANAPWPGGTIPTSSDSVVIPSGVVITVNTTAAALAINLLSPSSNNGITISSTNTLTVTRGIIIAAPSNTATNTVAVGTGTLTAGSISITGGSQNNRNAILSVSTGTITTTGTGISFGGTSSRAQLNFSGAGTVNIGGSGTITTGGTFTISTGTINYSGTAQTVGTGYTYYNLGLSGSGAKTMTGVTTVSGNFTMSGSATATPVITTIGGNIDISGTAVMTTGANNAVTGSLSVGANSTLTMGNFTLSIGTTSSITGTVNTAASATAAKTFTGAVTINSGGVWDLSTGNPTTTFGAGIVSGGTTFNNGTGAAAFSATSSLTGAGSMTLVAALLLHRQEPSQIAIRERLPFPALF